MDLCICFDENMQWLRRWLCCFTCGVSCFVKAACRRIWGHVAHVVCAVGCDAQSSVLHWHLQYTAKALAAYCVAHTTVWYEYFTL